MLNAGNPIGVMDSGIGGLTVVRELSSILATVPTAPTATRPLTRSSS